MLSKAVSKEEIISITANFSMPCGRSVFRGTLKTGQPAAIKRLDTNLPHQEILTKVWKNIVCVDVAAKVYNMDFVGFNNIWSKA